MNAVYLLSEIGVALLFSLCFAFAWRNRKRDNARALGILVSAALFAALFENLNVLQIHGRGSYSYNARFHVFIGQVPLFIILAWAVILWTAMQISDAAPLCRRDKIAWRTMACDAVLAVLLDLSFDATAIRHGFWNWHGVAFNQAWFGVPAGNFFGWMFVALTFSFCHRVLDWCVQTSKLNTQFRFWIQIILLPPFAFVCYRLIENSNNAVLRLFGWDPENASSDNLALGVFLAQFFALMLWSSWRRVSPNRDRKEAGWNGNKPASLRSRSGETAAKSVAAKSAAANIEYSNGDGQALLFARLCRVFFHVFAVCGLFALPASPLLTQQKPAILAVAGFVCLLDWLYEKRLRAKHIRAKRVVPKNAISL